MVTPPHPFAGAVHPFVGAIHPCGHHLAKKASSASGRCQAPTRSSLAQLGPRSWALLRRNEAGWLAAPSFRSSPLFVAPTPVSPSIHCASWENPLLHSRQTTPTAAPTAPFLRTRSRGGGLAWLSILWLALGAYRCARPRLVVAAPAASQRS